MPYLIQLWKRLWKSTLALAVEDEGRLRKEDEFDCDSETGVTGYDSDEEESTCLCICTTQHGVQIAYKEKTRPCKPHRHRNPLHNRNNR